MRTKLKQNKKNEKSAKMGQRRRSPQGGWGVGSKEPTQDIFYYARLQCFIGKCHLVLIEDEPKGLQNYQKVKTEERDTPEELRMAQKSIFGQHLLLFLDGPVSNQQAFISRKCPKTLWKCIWTTHKILVKISKLKL